MAHELYINGKVVDMESHFAGTHRYKRITQDGRLSALSSPVSEAEALKMLSDFEIMYPDHLHSVESVENDY